MIITKYKVIVFLFAITLYISFSNIVNSSATEIQQSIIVYTSFGKYQVVGGYTTSSTRPYYANIYDWSMSYVNGQSCIVRDIIATDFYDAVQQFLAVYPWNWTNNGYASNWPVEFYIGPELSGATFTQLTQDQFNDIINPPPEETSWWYDMWHDLGEQMGTPEFWFGEWFIGLIDGIFGNDDDTTITENVTIGIPSLAPTPTPIPYQTVVVPQINPVTGDTYYTYEYHYNNPSGTPIVATAPPPQPTYAAPGGNGGGDYAPINGDPYDMPDFPWLNTTVTIGDDNVDIFDGFGSGLDSIDSVGSEYTEGMNAATNAFGFLPSSWLILIGIGAGIILIAGIISRFLS